MSNHTTANEAEPIAASELVGLHNNTIPDPYFLRGLAWCGLCETPLVTVLISTGRRYYGCPSRLCKQTLVPARELEQVVWQRFCLLNEATALAVKGDERHKALRSVLVRVLVHSGLDLWFEWRD